MRITTYTSPPRDALGQRLRVERRLHRPDRRGPPVGAAEQAGNGTIPLTSSALVE